MLALISTALLVTVALMVPATLLVLSVPARPHRPLPTTLTSASLAGVVVGVAALALGAVLGAGAPRSLVLAVVLGGSLLAWAPLVDEWDLRGLTAWALGVDVALAFLAYVVIWILHADPGSWAMAAGVVVVLLEAVVLVVGLGYLWDFVDVLSRPHRHRGPRREGWGRPVREAAVVAVTGTLAVGGFLAFAAPVGGPADLAALPHPTFGGTSPTQASAPESGRALAPLTSSGSQGGAPTPVRLGTTALPPSTSSGVQGPTSGASSTIGPAPGSTTADPSIIGTSSTSPTSPTTSHSVWGPSSAPTSTGSPVGPSSDPTSTQTTDDPSTDPTHSHPTHPSHPTHSSHPTHPTKRPTLK